MEMGRTAMRQRALVVSAVAVASMLNVRTAEAQRSNFALVDEAAPAQHSGWILTPSLAYQGAWDDNALLIYELEPPSDFLSILNPRADVTFLGRRGAFDANYDGAFQMYSGLDTLNASVQLASVSYRRRRGSSVRSASRASASARISWPASVPRTEPASRTAWSGRRSRPAMSARTSPSSRSAARLRTRNCRARSTRRFRAASI